MDLERTIAERVVFEQCDGNGRFIGSFAMCLSETAPSWKRGGPLPNAAIREPLPDKSADNQAFVLAAPRPGWTVMEPG
jgi:hypothetical protein